MKTIGEQAREYRLWQGWSVARMAAEVGTSRQNIETLEAVGGRQPRYIADLARVMGTTVEILLAGRFNAPESGSTPPVARETPATYWVKPTPDQVLDALQELLATVPAPMRNAFADVLAGWARNGGADDRSGALLALMDARPKPDSAAA